MYWSIWLKKYIKIFPLNVQNNVCSINRQNKIALNLIVLVKNFKKIFTTFLSLLLLLLQILSNNTTMCSINVKKYILEKWYLWL